MNVYECPECGMHVSFYVGFVMAHLAVDRHGFTAAPRA